MKQSKKINFFSKYNKKLAPFCIALFLYSFPIIAQTLEEKLKALNIELPEVKAPIASYAQTVKTGNLLYLSGTGLSDANGKAITEKVGRDITVEKGQKATRSVAILYK